MEQNSVVEVDDPAAETEDMECREGICECPKGFLLVANACKSEYNTSHPEVSKPAAV